MQLDLKQLPTVLDAAGNHIIEEHDDDDDDIDGDDYDEDDDAEGLIS